MLTRRNLALGAGAMAIVACTQSQSRAEATETAKVTDINANIDWANLSDQDWKARLTDMEYRFYAMKARNVPSLARSMRIKSLALMPVQAVGYPSLPLTRNSIRVRVGRAFSM